MATVRDSVGNIITSEVQQPFGDYRLTIFLKRQKPRILGHINKRQRIFYTGEKQVSIVANNIKYFRFCKHVIINASMFDVICVRKSSGFSEKYCFDRKWLIEHAIVFGREDNTFSDNLFIDLKLVKEINSGRKKS